jgi:transcriptional regulator with XRE-family HTH domain
MTDLKQDLQATRAVEDELIRLGSERSRLERQLGVNLEQIVDAIPEATAAGISFDHIAGLVGVSRQTLYRWQRSRSTLRNG